MTKKSVVECPVLCTSLGFVGSEPFPMVVHLCWTLFHRKCKFVLHMSRRAIYQALFLHFLIKSWKIWNLDECLLHETLHLVTFYSLCTLIWLLIKWVLFWSRNIVIMPPLHFVLFWHMKKEVPTESFNSSRFWQTSCTIQRTHSSWPCWRKETSWCLIAPPIPARLRSS